MSNSGGGGGSGGGGSGSSSGGGGGNSGSSGSDKRFASRKWFSFLDIHLFADLFPFWPLKDDFRMEKIVSMIKLTQLKKYWVKLDTNLFTQTLHLL